MREYHNVRCKRGQALMDYAILIGLVSVVVIAAYMTVGEHVHTIYQSILDQTDTAFNNNPSP